jgi:hypothetical protein
MTFTLDIIACNKKPGKWVILMFSRVKSQYKKMNVQYFQKYHF